METIVYPNGTTTTITIPAGESIAIATYGQSSAKVYRDLGYPNYPTQRSLLGTVSNQVTVFGSYTSGASIIIQAGADPVYYEVGVAPVVKSVVGWRSQVTPGTLNATGALTAALIYTGVVTSTTAAAVAGTVPTGATMDLSSEWAIDEAFDWSVVNTGGTNAFTVTAASGHTLVGTAAVAALTTGRFRTRKTAADTFVTYRLA